MNVIDLSKIFHSDPNILAGTPVFVCTRVPVQSLFDHLQSGDSIDSFLEGFPSVQRGQVISLLEASRNQLLKTAWREGPPDENLDWRLRRELSGHTVDSVPLIGWAGLKNREMLARADGQYDVFLTMDANLSFQQYLATLRIAVVVLKAASNRLADTRPLMRDASHYFPLSAPAHSP